MLEILKAIDLLLQSRFVRWALMVTIVIITALCVYYRFQCAALTAEVKAVKAKAAEYETAIDRQNAAIRQAADEYEVLAHNFDDATAKAQALEKQLAKRKVEVREVVLQGTCDDMVQQVIKVIRK